jgi:hypothetical protein
VLWWGFIAKVIREKEKHWEIVLLSIAVATFLLDVKFAGISPRADLLLF